MSGVEDFPTTSINEFKYKWNIENISIYIAIKERSLESPKFTVPSLDNSEFFLKLVKNDKDSAQCFLCRTDKGPESVKISYSFSIRSFYSSEHQILFKESSSSRPGVFDLKEFISKSEESLTQDDLLIECRLWQSETDVSRSRNKPESPFPVFCSVRTIYPKEERNFFVTMKNFSQMINGEAIKVTPDSATDTPYKISMSLQKYSYKVDGMTFRFKVDSSQATSAFVLRYSIYLVDAVKERHILLDGRFDCNEGIVQQGQEDLQGQDLLVKTCFLEKKDLYLPNDELLLLCEFAVSEGKPGSFVENTRYDTSDISVENREGSWSVYLNHFGNRHRFLFQLLAVVVLFLAFLPHMFSNSTL